MAATKENSPPLVWTVCVVLGLALIGVGFAWPALAGAPSEEDLSDATEFLSAGQAIESASAKQSREERAEELSAARERYRQARERVEAARAGPGRTAFWLKIAGGVVAAIGAGGLLANRDG